MRIPGGSCTPFPKVYYYFVLLEFLKFKKVTRVASTAQCKEQWEEVGRVY